MIDRDGMQKYILDRCDPDPETGCWMWTQSTTGSCGYGSAWWQNKVYRANRFSYLAFVGDIPRDMVVCHTCDRPGCVNPAHLFIGTQKQNIYDSIRKGRHYFNMELKNAGPCRGEEHGQSKLTEDDVREIRRLAVAGMTMRQMARRFGVNKSTIRDVVARVTWRHIRAEQPPLVFLPAGE